MTRGDPGRARRAWLAGAEDLHRTHASQTRDLVFHLARIRQIQHVVASSGDTRCDQDEVGRRLFRGHADALHVLRQSGQRLGDAVLHLHVVEVARRERDRQRERSGRGRLREHGTRPSTPFICCSSGATVSAITFGLAPGGAHDNRWRYDARIFADRQFDDASSPATTMRSDRTSRRWVWG